MRGQPEPVGTESAKEPTRTGAARVRAVSGRRANTAARAELLRQSDRAFEKAPELVGRQPEGLWAIRYLEAVRGFKPPPPPMSSADRVKLAETQADQMVQVILAVLDGLGLSAEDWERGHDLAAQALRAASTAGWEPL